MNEVLSLSSYSLSPNFIPTLATAAGMLALGVAVLSGGLSSRVSRMFGFLSLTLVVWLSCFALMYASTPESVALFWAKTAYLGIPFIPAGVYAFTVEVLGIQRERRPQVRAAFLGSAVFSALIVSTDLVFDDLYHFEWGYYPRYRMFALVYLAFFLGVLALSLGELIRSWRQDLPKTQQKRVRSFTLAFAVGYLALIDYLPTFGVDLYPFGYVAIFAFLVLSAWTIHRYRLVDITPSFAADEIIDTMADPLIVLDAENNIRVVNRAAQEVLGYNRAQLVSQPAEMLAGGEDGHAQRLVEALEQRIVRDREMVFRAADGSLVQVSVSISHLTDDFGDPAGSVVIARDVRERARVQQELAEVRRRLSQSREQERLRLAQELHDGPLQDLHGLDFQIGELSLSPGADGTFAKVYELRGSLQHVTRTLREICGNLRPPSLAPFGLEVAIRSHAQKRLQRHSELRLDLYFQSDGQALPQSTRLALFRIFQQALDNIIRHARADRVQVWFTLLSDQAVLEIEDNGRGFKVPLRWVELVQNGHLGLVGAVERAESIGGRLDIISAPGEGTVIRATAPIPEAQALQGEG